MRWLTAVSVSVALLAPVGAARAAEPAAPQIIYTRKEGDRFALHLMNADGTGDKAISGVTTKANLLPVSSPDGKRIAFMSGSELTGNDFGISIINVDGTGLRTLMVPSRPAGAPAWSPDGKQLAFVSGDELPNVYVADADGENARQISEGAGAVFPFWKDAQTLGRDPQQVLGERAAQAEHALAADVQGEAVPLRLIGRERRARLHRRHHDAVAHHPHARDVRGRREHPRRRVVVAEAPVEAEVRVAPMQARGSGGERRLRIDHRGQRLDVDLDQLGGVLCGADPDEAQTLRDAGLSLGLSCQFLDDVADVVAGVEEVGKEPGSDAGKTTAIDLYGVDGARRRASEFQDAANEALDRFGPAADLLRALVGQASWKAW